MSGTTDMVNGCRLYPNSKNEGTPSSTSHCEIGSAKADFATSNSRNPGWLFLEGQWGPADPLTFERDIHFDAIGDRDERNTFIHAVVLAVEGHGPVDRA